MTFLNESHELKNININKKNSIFYAYKILVNKGISDIDITEVLNITKTKL